MIDSILAAKKEMNQVFLSDGRRIPVTQVQAGPCVVTQIKTNQTDKYQAVQIGFGKKPLRKTTEPLQGHLRKVIQKNEFIPRTLKEITIEGELEVEVGETITADKVLKVGDLVNVTGVSKGKGFTGVMKRWGFSGGPRTHGQSDRQRAPGSIGQGSDPGRVHKGKKMPGRSGGEKVTLRNLLIVKLDADGTMWIKGQVPGKRDEILMIKKVGEVKEFPGLADKDNKDNTKIQMEETKDEKDSKTLEIETEETSKPNKQLNPKTQ